MTHLAQDTPTICRRCRREIEHGQLILEPDFTFETGLHAPENQEACIGD